MKISNKRELHQIAFNHLSDIDLKDFINLYKKRTEKSYSLLVIDATLSSDRCSFTFEKESFGKNIKTNHDN